jgi:C4-dicarboxylate-specific signal transduction histidine kinase
MSRDCPDDNALPPRPQSAVLIIDDDTDNLAIVSSLLEECGYTIFVAEDGESGIKRALLTEPDLILLDVLMPGLDGIKTCRRLKGDLRTRDIPVIFMTALAEMDHKVRGFKAGAVDYITKPLQREELLARVTVHIRLRHLAKELRDANELLEQRVEERTRALARTNEELQREVAERKVAEEALAVKQGQLQALNAELGCRVAEEVEKNLEKDRLLFHNARLAAMGELLNNIAHQWRQPLNSIALLIQGMVVEVKKGEMDQESLLSGASTCLEKVRYLSKTINLFQSFFTPEEERREFDPAEIVEKAVSLVRASYEESGIRLEANNRGSRPVTGFAIELSQVILNLLNNAKDVLIERQIPQPAVTVECSVEEGRNVITVGDNAGGIPTEVIEKIFDPYFTTKFKSQGTGIGLYMSKMIIEKNMGGTLTVRNSGDGALFCIELPTT